MFLNKFFEEKWDFFYRVAIALLKFYEPKLLKLRDIFAIVGQIKQAREGCEHLMPTTASVSSLSLKTELSHKSEAEDVKRS